MFAEDEELNNATTLIPLLSQPHHQNQPLSNFTVTGERNIMSNTSTKINLLNIINVAAYVFNTTFTYGVGNAGWFGGSTNSDLSLKYQVRFMITTLLLLPHSARRSANDPSLESKSMD